MASLVCVPTESWTSDPWDDPLDPFNTSAAGYLGDQRRSMLQNELLHKTGVGVSKSYCRKLPPRDFIYGRPNEPGFTAAEVLTHIDDRHWDCTPLAGAKTKAPPANLLALNRAAVSAGVTTSLELRDFRDTHGSYSGKAGWLKPETRPPQRKLKPNTVYGSSTKSTSWVADTMTLQPLREFMRCAKSSRRTENDKPLTKMCAWKENNASQLRMVQVSAGLKPPILWHMSKFDKQAKPHLSTFRNLRDQLAAHNANNYSRVGRDGAFGQGIPTRAVNRRDVIYTVKA